MEKLLNVTETAELLGVKKSTLYTWSARGKIPVQKVSGALRFSPSALTRWLSCQAHPTSLDAIRQVGRPSRPKRPPKSAHRVGAAQGQSR
jgi:excisionase family DNA binding protein